MEKVVLSRQNLEAMSTADLMALTKTYGINIPVDLNRNFIIGELLEINEENQMQQNETTALNETDASIATTLPKSYNDTTINIFLRNPVWLFAYWDIKESDVAAMKNSFDFEEVFIHISFFENESDEKPFDSFDVKIDFENNDLYILIPANRHYVSANLAYRVKGEQPKILAYTPKLEIPQEAEEVRNLQPGKKLKMSEITKLSGMNQMLYKQFMTHRQSFSN